MYTAQHLLSSINTSLNLRHDLWLQGGSEMGIHHSNGLLCATMELLNIYVCNTGNVVL